jgi:hypothetical protein
VLRLEGGQLIVVARQGILLFALEGELGERLASQSVFVHDNSFFQRLVGSEI